VEAGGDDRRPPRYGDPAADTHRYRRGPTRRRDRVWYRRRRSSTPERPDTRLRAGRPQPEGVAERVGDGGGNGLPPQRGRPRYRGNKLWRGHGREHNPHGQSVGSIQSSPRQSREGHPCRARGVAVRAGARASRGAVPAPGGRDVLLGARRRNAEPEPTGRAWGR